MKTDELKAAQTRLTRDLYAEIEFHADTHGRSISKEIEQLIKEAMGYRSETTHQFVKPRKKKRKEEHVNER